MSNIITKGHYISSNGIDTIAYYEYKSQTPPVAIIQLSHGMCGYFERYKHLIEFLVSHNILVCGNDHLGHGNSVKSKLNLGYFSLKDGFKHLSEDLYKLTTLMKKKYPQTPYFLLGDGMGSSVVRTYLTKYSKNVDGSIIIGTTGTNPFSKSDITATNFTYSLKGEKYRSKFINKLVFGKYNDSYGDKKTEFDWLSTDKRAVSKFISDPYCNFIFTTSAFKDLINLASFVTSQECIKQTPKSLPIYIMSGNDDPVGDYGDGVTSFYNSLKQVGFDDVDIKLYQNCRHEILNEINYEEVFDDILTWINNHISNLD